MKSFYSLSVIAPLLVLFFTIDLACAAPVAKPNIILILTDDVGPGNVSCYGADNYKTPNIDALAKNGVRFSQCYSMPQCSPSRCVTITGRYPFRTGLIKNNTVTVDPKKEVSIATVMKQASYVTGSVGKWHISYSPAEWGFDETLVFPGSGLYWRATNESEKAKLQAILTQLNPASGTPTGDDKKSGKRGKKRKLSEAGDSQAWQSDEKHSVKEIP
jgi:arylsulfatase A